MSGTTPSSTLVPTGWDATGQTDVSAKISAWLTKNVAMGPFSLPPGATYRIDEGLTLQDIANLDLSPWGTETPHANFFTKDPALDQRNRTLLSCIASTHMTVGPLRLRGPNYGLTTPPVYDKNVEGQAGVAVSNGTDGFDLLDGYSIQGTLGDGVYVGANLGADPSQRAKNVIIGKGWINNVGRQGIAVVNADTVTIKGVTISNTGHSAIDLEPWGGNVTNVVIDGVQTFGIKLCFVAAMGAQESGIGGDVSGVTIQNCHANEGLLIEAHPLNVPRRHDWKILNNTSDWTLGGEFAAFNLTNIDNVTIAGNHQPLIVGATPQTRKPWSDKAQAEYLLGNGCKNVTVGADIYNDDGTVQGPSGLPPNTWT